MSSGVADVFSLSPALLGHVGFTLLQVGLCRPKNTSSIVIANLSCFFLSIILYWACGYAFALPTGASNVFLSHTKFFLIDASDSELAVWPKHSLMVSLVVIIMNAGFAERMRYWLYPFLTVFVAGFLYPVSSHWAWNNDGWLKKGVNTDSGDQITFLDEGGTSTIHTFAGGVGLIGALLVGPRLARIDMSGKFHPLGGQINAYVLIGGILALIGLLAKTILLTTYTPLVPVNCLLAMSGSACIAFLMKRTRFTGEVWNSRTLINSALAGIIAVGGAPGSYHPYGGFVIGVVAGIAYVAWNALLVLCRIDDPTDVVAVQLSSGFWGTIATYLFHKTHGIFYSGSNAAFRRFGWNMLGGLAFFVWAGITTFILLIGFMFCKKMKYHHDSSVHTQGLDIATHSEPAYPGREHYPELDEKSIFDTFLTVKGPGIESGYYGDQVYHNAGLERAPQQPNGKEVGQQEPNRMSVEEERYQYWVQQQAQRNARDTLF